MSLSPSCHWTCRLCGSAGLACKEHPFCMNCGHGRDYDGQVLAVPRDRVVDRFMGSTRRCCGVGYSEEASFCARCGSSLLAAPPMLWDGPPSEQELEGWSLWIDQSLEGAAPHLLDGVEVVDDQRDATVDLVGCLLVMDDEGRVSNETHTVRPHPPPPA